MGRSIWLERSNSSTVAKAGKVGKVAKGTKKIKGVKGLHPSEKLARLGELSKGSLRKVKQKGKDLTAEGRAGAGG